MKSPHRRIAGRALLVAAALSVATACNSDVTGTDRGSVRFLAVEGNIGFPQQLVEFQAAPLTALRSMPLVSGDTTTVVLLHDGPDGGFYALRYAGFGPQGQAWQLLRYDANWHVAASVTGAVLLDSTSLNDGPNLTLTGDHRHLVAAINSIQTSRLLTVLDPVTLATVNLTGRPLPQFPEAAPTAATGSQVLLTSLSGVCPQELVWLDVLTGQTADSTTAPCGYALEGAATHRRIYRLHSDSALGNQLDFYDITTGTVIAATTDSLRSGFLRYALAPHGRVIVFEPFDAKVFDAGSLARLGTVPTGADESGPRTTIQAVVDSATGLVIGTTASRTFCADCYPTPDGIIVLDPDRLTLDADKVIGTPLELVP